MLCAAGILLRLYVKRILPNSVTILTDSYERPKCIVHDSWRKRDKLLRLGCFCDVVWLKEEIEEREVGDLLRSRTFRSRNCYVLSVSAGLTSNAI